MADIIYFKSDCDVGDNKVRINLPAYCNSWASRTPKIWSAWKLRTPGTVRRRARRLWDRRSFCHPWPSPLSAECLWISSCLPSRNCWLLAAHNLPPWDHRQWLPIVFSSSAVNHRACTTWNAGLKDQSTGSPRCSGPGASQLLFCLYKFYFHR